MHNPQDPVPSTASFSLRVVKTLKVLGTCPSLQQLTFRSNCRDTFSKELLHMTDVHLLHVVRTVTALGQAGQCFPVVEDCQDGTWYQIFQQESKCAILTLNAM